jgi:hypothetical protein
MRRVRIWQLLNTDAGPYEGAGCSRAESGLQRRFAQVQPNGRRLSHGHAHRHWQWQEQTATGSVMNVTPLVDIALRRLDHLHVDRAVMERASAQRLKEVRTRTNG